MMKKLTQKPKEKEKTAHKKGENKCLQQEVLLNLFLLVLGFSCLEAL